MENKYTSKEVAEILGVSDKSVRRYLNSYFSIENGTYQVSEKMLEVLKNEYLGQAADNLRTTSDKDVQEYRAEYFTEEEYAEFQKCLIEYHLLKEQLEYHKKSAESHQKQMEVILKILEQKNILEQQRNVLEARDKRISFTDYINLDEEKNDKN